MRKNVLRSEWQCNEWKNVEIFFYVKPLFVTRFTLLLTCMDYVRWTEFWNLFPRCSVSLRPLSRTCPLWTNRIILFDGIPSLPWAITETYSIKSVGSNSTSFAWRFELIERNHSGWYFLDFLTFRQWLRFKYDRKWKWNQSKLSRYC